MAEYRTRQREMILDYMIKNKDIHVTADMIIKYFQFHETPIGKATVYRNLDKLVSDNIVRKFTIEDGTGACYQYSGAGSRCREHYHFKCTRCGELYHIQCDFMNEISSHVYKEHKFKIDSSKTVFYGICEKCGN
ncbi:MAG: Fur family transcriptional regulator [Lachnospiraceae bacterium]